VNKTIKLGRKWLYGLVRKYRKSKFGSGTNGLEKATKMFALLRELFQRS